LQDALNIDVNALLFCAWLGAEKKLALNEANLAAIGAEVERWHRNVVRPLRAVRQTMKPMPEMADDAVAALRKDVAAAELRAEQIEQAMLFSAAGTLSAGATTTTPAEAVADNVAAFIRRHTTAAVEMPPARLLIAAATAYRPPPSAKSP
jgi:uncharacterized protein (TIGR02444 family)